MDLEELIQLFNKYKERNIDSESAKKLQEYLISRGYDIGFLDTNGNIRKDPDGRLGYKTLDALNREIAILRGNYPDNYQSDFMFTFGGDPTYNTVVGRSPEDVRNMAHVYYNYYSQHPEMYAGLLQDKKQAATVLPYLSDEAKSLLSKKVEEWAYKNGRTLNIPEMANQGLLGSRGLELQQQWEQANVRDAQTRGLNNLVQVIGGDILGAGQKVMGRLTGGSNDEMGGLTYTTRYNPVTRQKQRVAVPNKTATVWSNIPNMKEGYALDEMGHSIMSADGNLVQYKIPQPVKDVTGVVVNTVTDPLTWMMSAGDYVPGQRVTYQTANVPAQGYIDDVVHVTEGVDLWNPTTTVVREPARYITGRPAFSITGNRKTGFRGKHGGINNIVSTQQNTYKYIPATTEEVPAINLGIKDVDYLYHRPSLEAYVTERLPSTHKSSFGIWPAIQGTPIEYGNVGFISSQPSGYARFKYQPNGSGRKIVYTDVTDDEQALEVPTSKTRNIWANQPQTGLVPQYWMGIYKCGGRVKKRCRKKSKC